MLHRVDTTLSDRLAKVVDNDNNLNPNDAAAMWLPGESFVDSTNGFTVAVNAQVGNGFQVTITNGTGIALTVAKAGTGGGTVTSSDGTINCGSTCSKTVSSGAQITLSAAPASNSTFMGWSGGGWSGTGTCTVTVTATTTVTATFTLRPPVSLAVVRAGTGSGTVTSSDGAINCGSTCSETVANGTQVTLTATPAAGSNFTSWGGCTSTSGATCTVTLTAATTVTATFTLKAVTLTVTILGSGTGTVTTGDGKINCGATCSATYNSGTSVTLIATGSGAVLKQWGGACSGVATTCTLTLNANQSATATFSESFTDGSGPNAAIPIGGSAVIKAVHILELRTAINNLRVVNKLAAYSWTDPTLTAQSTVAKRSHFLDLRTALAAVCTAVPGKCTGYTDATISTGQTIIKAAHLNEVRANVRALE